MAQKITKKITVPKQLCDKAIKIIGEGKIPGVRSFSGLCEYALVKLLESMEAHK